MNYGYISIRTGLTKSELRKKIVSSKLYDEYLEMISSMRDMFFSIPNSDILSPQELIDDSMLFSAERTLQVDIMTSQRSNMHFKLNSIINYAKENPGNSIVILINSINAFGNSESIKRYYEEFRKYKIKILLIDYTRECGLSEYSTCNFGLKFRPQNELNRAYDLIEQLTDDDVPDNRGRKASEYSKAFRVAFWLYELFKIPEKIAVSMSGYSKNGFHMKADNYEQTVTYMRELKIMETNFQITKYIKRNRPVPENFDKLIHWEEKKKTEIQQKKEWIKRQSKKLGKIEKAESDTSMTSLELACIHCKVPMIFPEDYERLKLKMENGRKELARCLRMYDNDLIEKYNEWTKLGKEPTEFYTVCDMEKYLQ